MARKVAAKIPKAAAPTGTAAPETIAVTSERIACDGIGGALGHPRVWLQIGASGFVECPYCDRRFVLGAKADATPGVYVGASGH